MIHVLTICHVPCLNSLHGTTSFEEYVVGICSVDTNNLNYIEGQNSHV